MKLKDLQTWQKKHGLEDTWNISVEHKTFDKVFSLKAIHALMKKYSNKNFEVKHTGSSHWSSLPSVDAQKAVMVPAVQETLEAESEVEKRSKKKVKKRGGASVHKVSARRPRGERSSQKTSSGTPMLWLGLILVGVGAGVAFWLSSGQSSEEKPQLESEVVIVHKLELDDLAPSKVSSEAPVTVLEPKQSAVIHVPDAPVVPEVSNKMFNSFFKQKHFKEELIETNLFSDLKGAKNRFVDVQFIERLDGRKDVQHFKSRKKTTNKIFFVRNNKSALPLKRDKLGVIHCWIKVKASEQAHLSFELRQRDQKRNKSSFAAAKVISLQRDEWIEVNIPFRANISCDVEDVQFSVTTRHSWDELWMSNLKVILVPDETVLADLPSSHTVSYVGREADAAWRQAAQKRIEKHRMSSITLRFKKGEENLSGAKVQLHQKRHHFQHASAMNFRMITGQGSDHVQYRKLAKKLFNSSSAENAHKWRLLVMGNQKRITEKYEAMVKGNQWLHNNGLPVRGHVLVWPGFQKLPNQYGQAHQAGTLDWDQLRRDIVSNIHKLGDLTREHTFEWDVLNEPYSNHDLTDHFGDEIMLEWFEEAQKAFPNHGLFLNDYGILRIGEYELKHREHFFKTVDYLAKHSKMTGFAMQAHFRDNTINTPEGIWEVMEELGKHDLDMRITEFDLDSLDEELVADYLGDVLTLTFSHPKMLGFQTWGFWKKTMNVRNSALVSEDFKLTPAGQRFQDLIFKEWWSHVNTTCDDESRAKMNVFYGEHEVTVEHDGQIHTETIHVLPTDKTSVYTITL